jgi:NRE family putative nickel resistance protein-like MFS transporter
MRISEPLKALKEPLFAKLYFAQAVSLLGDAFTWMGIALLAFELGKGQSAKILATALTLRVTAFIVFGSYAGVLADRFSRKKIMIITNLFRMSIVFSLAFVYSVWQLYVLIFILNVFNAFFTPAYKACIPQLISRKENYGNAISLSNATWQLLGILGPGIAGALAVLMGSRQIFFFDALSFIVSSILVYYIPIVTLNREGPLLTSSFLSIWTDVLKGIKLLFRNPPIRFSLLIELVAAIAGAQIIVNSVGHIKADLLLSDNEYGWIMAAFGVGATIGAFTANSIDKSKSKAMLMIAGALILSSAIPLANIVSYQALIILWIIAGLGQSYADMPSQILIAENINLEQQGKVYGSHFAWTHLWWAIGYIIAGYTATHYKTSDFLIGGILSLLILAGISLHRFFLLRSGRIITPGP